MSMLMGLSLPMHAHESFMIMLVSFSRTCEAFKRKTTLGQTAAWRPRAGGLDGGPEAWSSGGLETWGPRCLETFTL